MSDDIVPGSPKLDRMSLRKRRRAKHSRKRKVKEIPINKTNEIKSKFDCSGIHTDSRLDTSIFYLSGSDEDSKLNETKTFFATAEYLEQANKTNCVKTNFPDTKIVNSELLPFSQYEGNKGCGEIIESNKENPETQFNFSDTQLNKFYAEAQAVYDVQKLDLKFTQWDIVNKYASKNITPYTPKISCRAKRRRTSTITENQIHNFVELENLSSTEISPVRKNLCSNDFLEDCLMKNKPKDKKIICQYEENLSNDEMDLNISCRLDEDIDLNKSSKLCENIQNLSMLFSQSLSEDATSDIDKIFRYIMRLKAKKKTWNMINWFRTKQNLVFRQDEEIEPFLGFESDNSSKITVSTDSSNLNENIPNISKNKIKAEGFLREKNFDLDINHVLSNIEDVIERVDLKLDTLPASKHIIEPSNLSPRVVKYEKPIRDTNKLSDSAQINCHTRRCVDITNKSDQKKNEDFRNRICKEQCIFGNQENNADVLNIMKNDKKGLNNKAISTVTSDFVNCEEKLENFNKSPKNISGKADNTLIKKQSNEIENSRLPSSDRQKELRKEGLKLKNKEKADDKIQLNKSNHLGDFKTVLGKLIQLSNDALSKAQSILEDFNKAMWPNIIDNNNLHDNKNKDAIQTVTGSAIFQSIAQNSNSKNGFQGFKSAWGKPIQISNEELSKAQSIFNDVSQTMQTENIDSNLHNDQNKDVIQGVTDSGIFQSIAQNSNSKNGFQGFKSAWGKPIQISNEALSKAQSIFNDVSQTMQKENINRNFHNDQNKDVIKGVTDSGIFQSIAQNSNSKNGFQGFKSAWGEPIQISNEALSKAQSIFNDVNQTMQTENIDSNFHNDQNKDVIEGVTDSGIFQSIAQNSNSKNGFQGFKSAWGKPIQISNEALSKAQSIFNDVSQTMQTENINRNLHNDQNKDVIQGVTDSGIFQSIAQNSNSKNGFQGFKSDWGKPIQISNEALSKAQSIFNDVSQTIQTENIDSNFHNDQNKDVIQGVTDSGIFQSIAQNSNSKNGFQGFKSAWGKPIQISNEALSKAQSIFNHVNQTMQTENIDSNLHNDQSKDVIQGVTDSGIFQSIAQNSNSKNGFQGFKSAWGKPIQISNEALSKAQNIFNDVNQTMQTENIDSNLHNDQNRDVIQGVTDSGIFQSIAQNSNSKNVFQGFKSAWGKPIQISNEALSKAQSIFNDVNQTMQTENINRNLHNDQSKDVIQGVTDSGTFQSIAQNSNSKNGFQGFKSACGKPIQISNEALSKAQSIFNDVNQTMQTENINRNLHNDQSKDVIQGVTDSGTFQSIAQNSNSKNGFQGFKSAWGKPIQISNEALSKAQSIFNDVNQTMQTENIDSNLHNDKSKDVIQGVTDSGTFQSIAQNSNSKNGFQGFKSACGKPIQISNEALSKAQSIFNDVNQTMQTENINRNLHNDQSKDVIQGVTDSGTFQSIAQNSNSKNGFQGFKSAWGKPIQISNEALSKAQSIFNDVNQTMQTENIDSNLHNDKSKDVIQGVTDSGTFQSIAQNSNSKNGFQGFKSAWGKPIQISNEALSKAQSIFNDVNQTMETEIIDSHLINDKKKEEVNKIFKDSRAFQAFSQNANSKNGLQDSKSDLGERVQAITQTLSKLQSIFDLFPLVMNAGDIDNEKYLELYNKLVDFQSLYESIQFKSETDMQKMKNFIEPKKIQGGMNSNFKEDTNYQHFRNASGRAVQISQEAIIQAENFVLNINDPVVLSQTSDSVEKSKFSTGCDSGNAQCLTANKFRDFQSSARGCIKVCSVALTKARNMLLQVESKIPDLEGQKRTRNFEINQGNELSTTRSSPELQGISGDVPQLNCLEKYKSNSSELSVCGNYELEFKTKKVTRKGKIDENLNLDFPALETFKTESENSKIILRKKSAARRLSLPRKRPELSTEGSISTPTSNKISLISKNTPNLIEFFNSVTTSTPESNSKQQSNCEECPTLSQEVTDSVAAIVKDEMNGSEQRLIKKLLPKKLLKEFEKTEITEKIQSKRLINIKKQESLIKRKSRLKQKISPGVCYVKKQKENRTPLADLLKGDKVDDCSFAILEECGVDKNIAEITFSNSFNYTFEGKKYFQNSQENVDGFLLSDKARIILDSNNRCGFSEFRRSFLAMPNVDPKLIPNNWLEHHFKMIVFKLADLERTFPYQLSQKVLNPENLMEQLKYRYDLEIDNVKRSPLRKILECDENPAKRIVLVVIDIYKNDNNSRTELELSDRWYSIKTCIDDPIQNLIEKNQIKIGTKLMIQNAELLNCEDGCNPLEIPETIKLKIYYNSTRRAKWDTKLGFYKIQSPIVLPLNLINENGGIITKIRFFILRLYPMLYLGKNSNGVTKELHSEKVELRQKAKEDCFQFENFEAIFSQVQNDIEQEVRKKRNENSMLRKNFNDLSDTEEILEWLQYNTDRDIEDEVTSTQQERLAKLRLNIYNKKMEEINERVKERLKNQHRKSETTEVLKLRIIDYRYLPKTAILTIWRPDETIKTICKEGNCLDITNISTNGIRYDDLQLSATKSSKFKQNFNQKYIIPSQSLRNIICINEINSTNFKPIYNELDTIGVVVEISSIEPKKFQSVFLADLEMNLLRINFWGSIKDYAYENVIEKEKFLVVNNLQWRSNSSKTIIPSAFVTNITTFTENPKSKNIQNEYLNFIKGFEQINLSQFIEKCYEKIIAFKSQPSHNLTPKNINDLNISFNSTNNNLNQTPKNLSNKSGPSVQQRIERLNCYGDSPRITPFAYNKCRKSVRKGFKPPKVLDN